MITALAIIFGIGIMILIHEFGHFLFARIFGITVKQFSIGFGPPIIKIQGKQTLYKITPFPIGGYIEMKGENPDEELEGTKDEFLSRKPWEKIIIAFAGPFFNIILAFIILPIAYFGFGMKDIKLPDYAQIAHVQSGYPAEKSGLKMGDIILKINGKKINNPEDVSNLISTSTCETLSMVIKRNTEILTIKVKPKKITEHYFSRCVLGISFVMPPIVGKLDKKSRAYRDGLRENDRILSVNGNKIISFDDIYNFIDGNKPLNLFVQRGNKKIKIQLHPVRESNFTSKGKIKRMYTLDILPPYEIRKPKFKDGVKIILSEIGRDFSLIYLSLKIVITHPKESKNLGGPIAIGYLISKSVEQGMASYLSLIALISINLAVVNFLPLVITDGGLILLFIYEWIARRRISKKARTIFANIGWALLMLLFIFVIFNDIMRFF